MKLTKKEIRENVRSTRRPGFGMIFNYVVNIRGFHFETLQDHPGELYEEDEQGKMTFVNSINNKTDVVNSVYAWFQEYAPQEFD